MVNEPVTFALGLPTGVFTSGGEPIVWIFSGPNTVIGTISSLEGPAIEALIDPTTGAWYVEILRRLIMLLRVRMRCSR